MARVIDPQRILDSYHEASSDVRVRYLKISCLLVVAITLSGVGLDSVVYPKLRWDLLQSRLACVALTMGIFAVCFTAFGRRIVSLLGILWASVVQMSICYMVLITEGAMSPYYAGLNLAILGVAIFLPWTFTETLIVCAITLLGYLGACLLHTSTPLQPQLLFNNVSFLFFTDVICGTASYFTSRARFEEFRLRHELDTRNKELAELDRLKSEFFANVSHELRTPLTLIIAPLDEILRQRDSLPREAYEPLIVVQQNALRLLKLINDLLEIVRLENERATLKKERVDFGVLLPALIDSIRHLALAKGLKIDASGDAKLELFADPNRLEKVCLNILINAIKFTPPGGTIATRWKLDSNQVVVEISDTGIGVSEKDLPYIFDRFRQADGTSTRKHQGLGIGLALARELVQEHGGKLTAKSQLGLGTTFRVELPLTTAEETARPKLAPIVEDPIEEMYTRSARVIPDVPMPRAESTGKQSGQGEFLILVVDDEPDMRRFLVSMLEVKHRVLQAADGKSGLELARKHHPDVVLLDLMLPEMNGLDVCRNIKSDAATSDVRIILLTARGDEQTKIDALECGADDFLTKPFSTLEVRTRIANLLRAALAEREVRVRNTELQLTLKTLKETESQLVQSEKMNALGGLAAGLLHEINNPLNYTLTAMQLAQQSVPKENADLHEMLSDMSHGMTRIRDIITDLRTFAYPTTSEKHDRFDMTEALESALRLVSHEAQNVEVVSSVPKGTLVSGSKSQVVQVLVNLLVNSCKALRGIKDLRGRIAIAAREEHRRVFVSVSDNGCGISEAALPKIFDPFYTTRPVGEGMGLGLSICHAIIKKHGGAMTVRSTEGQSTEITFDLPAGNEEVRINEPGAGLQTVRHPVCG